jgi:hypothetical protein
MKIIDMDGNVPFLPFVGLLFTISREIENEKSSLMYALVENFIYFLMAENLEN